MHNNWKSNNTEHVKLAMCCSTYTHVEFRIMKKEADSLGVRKSYKILYYPNIWIVDTVTTCQTTYSDIGMTNVGDPHKEDGFTMVSYKEQIAYKLVYMKVQCMTKVVTVLYCVT